MLPCEPYRDRLLDHLYGLLDPSEAAALDEHVVGCADCTTAQDEATRLKGLFAKAAKSEYPEVSFVPPVAPEIVPSELNHAAAALPAEMVEPAVQVTVQSAWMKWAIAASLLLAVASLGGPAIRDSVGFLLYKPVVDRELAGVDTADAARKQRSAELKESQRLAIKKMDDARKKTEQLAETWLKKEEHAIAAASTQPFVVTIMGPSTALAGAPNEYKITVADSKTKQAKAVTLEAKVLDADGKALFEQKFEKTANATLKLPASMWNGVKPGTELVLQIAATDAASGAQGLVTEQIRLLDPTFTTFLTTDKPMYRPGETVYFRSLTLDRTRFLPPERELNLRFELLGPDGTAVPGLNVYGLAKPVAEVGKDVFRPVLGPDGRPVSGIGTGAFALPAELAGGEYKLTVTELALNSGQAIANSKVLAERKFLVNKYTPDRLQKKLEFDAKTYGPGDVVQAKFEVKDQTRVVAQARLTYYLQVVFANGTRQPVTLEVAPPQTDAAGTASVRFTLPKSGELRSAVLTVTVDDTRGPETLVRDVPLAPRVLDIEFFPEGGDLVSGVENRVYFRSSNNRTGRPADVTGVLTDGTRDICDVKTLTDPDHPGVNQGLGLFTFTPEAGKLYYVRLDRPLGLIQPGTATPSALAAVASVASSSRTFHLLPPAKASGVALTILDGVTRTGQPIRVRLASAGAKRTVLIGAYTRGRPVVHQRATLEPGTPTDLTLDLGGSKLGGVTRITVFEEPAGDEPGRDDLKPVAERLVYRQPGETLRLAFTATRDGKAVTGAFLPGDPVELAITSYDETGKPKPAILWAAVVNQSVVAMADEKTARLLPTHFLLGGEVRKSDDLEHADFLLTDHPMATAGLDLLLGTQGWRRFAEQAPEQFKKREPGIDADRLLVAISGNNGIPAGWKDGVRRVIDEYWPQYEAAALELEQAERDQRTGDATRGAKSANDQAEGEYRMKLTSFGSAAADLDSFDKGMEARKAWLPATLVFVFGIAALMIAVRFFRPAGAPERRTLTLGGIAFLALGLFVLFAVAITALGGDRWKTLALTAPKPQEPYGRFTPAPMPATVANEDAAPGMVGKQDQKKLNKGGPDVVQGKAPMVGGKAPPVKPGVAVDPRAQERFMPEPGAPRPAVPKGRRAAPPPQAGKPDVTRRLEDALSAIVKKASAEGDPKAVQYAIARNRIAQSVPQVPLLVVREYAHRQPPPTADGTRSDFAETLLWQPVLVVPDSGTAKVSFSLSDAINGYQVLVAGHTLDGRLGAVTGTIEVRKPFVVEPKLPQEIGAADKLDVPLVLSNGTAEQQTASIELTLKGLSVEGAADKMSAVVPANAGTRKFVRLVPDKQEGKLSVKVAADADGLTDAVERSLTVVPDGFPAEGGTSDMLEQQTRSMLTLPSQWTKGTLKATVTLYPNTLSELQAGLDGLLREPSGCFEQSSTANYPNVLITRYFMDTGQANPDLSRRARDLMDRGYNKLTAYECPKTGANRIGYEWFGASDRPHEALTAYGLLQFTDMAGVYPVDPAMLKRTKQFLIDSRDGNGGFKRNARALDTFGRAPDHVTNAYIAWAVSEAERGSANPSDLTKEVDTLFSLATKKDEPTAKDPYFLALVANTLLNRGRQADGLTLLKSIAALQTKEGSVPGAMTSITLSSGRALLIESTALAVLGWLKANRPELFLANVREAMKWIGSQRDPGGSFGSTQSTILALKALVEHARASKRPAESGELRVFVGGREVGTKAFTTESTGPIVIEIPEESLKPGKNEVRVETTAKQAYPVSVTWSCRSRQPASSPDCAVKLETKLVRADAVEGDSVRLEVKVQKLKAKPQGMVVAIIGIPAGLKVPEDMKQMRTMTAVPADGSEPTVSHWETRGRELVLYWRGMASNQTVSVALDLIADFPGEYRGPASLAYLYYDADHKHWVEPVDVKVRAR